MSSTSQHYKKINLFTHNNGANRWSGDEESNIMAIDVADEHMPLGNGLQFHHLRGFT